MPIQLNYTDPNTGQNSGTSYWFAQIANIDRINNNVTFTMNGFFNLAAKNAGKLPFASKTIQATFAQLGLSGSTTLAQLGNALDNYALTYSEIITPTQTVVFFQGGTIV